MRELFDEISGHSPLDPTESARQGMRTPQHKRFYRDVTVSESSEGFAVLLDGKSVRTPGRRVLAAPSRDLANAIGHEWEARKDFINPMTMPLTRLANSIIEGVAAPVDDAAAARGTDVAGRAADVARRVADVAADVAKYFESDLLFYRAEHPQALVARESEAWDPIIRWAAETLGARFILAEGIVHARQPVQAVSAARAALPDDAWAIGALHSATTLTGSALLALALMHGFRNPPEIWAAAHVDEDWNMEQWGVDDAVLARRATRFHELEAAALVLRAMKQTG
jgi:chaperone required for assembly of F1-ATPase